MGLTLLIEGVTLGALTVKLTTLDPVLPGLMTCADQLACAVVKFAEITNRVELKLVGVLSKVPPLVRSFSRTNAPETKLLPFTVKF